jgi:hypothetical protein
MPCGRLKSELMLDPLYIPRTKEYQSPRQRYWKIPDKDVGGDMTGAHSVPPWNENSEGRRPDGVARFGNMNIKYSGPNELTQDVEIGARRAVRAVRTSRIGLSTAAKASTLSTDISTTKSKESSFQIAAFVINHPILAMLVLALIALIGSICIFALPIGWLPF